MELGVATFADLSCPISPRQRMLDLREGELADQLGLREGEIADQLDLDVFDRGPVERMTDWATSGLMPAGEEQWIGSVARHWNLDHAGPR